MTNETAAKTAVVAVTQYPYITVAFIDFTSFRS